MNKILGYIAVFLVFSWVTTANATVATITDSNGTLTVTGFLGATPAERRTMDFAFDFTAGSSGIVNVFQNINSGQIYTVNANFSIDALGSFFNTNFDILSTVDIAAPVATTVDAALLANPAFDSGAGNFGTISVNVNGFPVSLDLTRVAVSTIAGNPILTLSTNETDANGNLYKYFTCLDGWGGGCTGASQPGDGGYRNGSISSGFTNANLTVPEPATLLLLGSGLLGMFGFSRKRA